MLKIDMNNIVKPQFNVNKIIIRQKGLLNKPLIEPKQQNKDIQTINPSYNNCKTEYLFEIY